MEIVDIPMLVKAHDQTILTSARGFPTKREAVEAARAAIDRFGLVEMTIVGERVPDASEQLSIL